MSEYADRLNCAAHGCPLHGGLAVGGEWVCRHHYGQQQSRWQAITGVLREHEKLLQLVQKILGDNVDARGPDGRVLKDDEQLAKVAIWAEKHYPELIPKEERSIKTWAYRADAWLASAAARKAKNV